MLLSAAALYGVGASSAFEFADLQVSGAVYTDPERVSGVLDEVRGENLFRLSTAALTAELRELPTVDDARIRIALPRTINVSLVEREPVLLWTVGARRYLADDRGVLLGLLGDAPPEVAQGLPVIIDQRAASAGLSVGARLDPVDVDAATRLASLTPAQVGSAYERLRVVVTDDHGFELRAQPRGWTAVFGFYTPSLRTTELIPGQVRLLTSLLVGREPEIESIILADENDGTYVPRVTPTPPPSETP